MTNKTHIQLLRSNEIVSNEPKKPNVSSINYGEIAVNYHNNNETLFMKNDNNNIVGFSSDDNYTEKKLGSAFTDTNKTVTELFGEYIKKPVTIWEAPEGTNGFYAINNTGFTTWQIEDVDLSAYKYVRFYIKASDLAFDSTTSEYTQAVYVDVLLDDVSINQNSPAYIGVNSTILPNNRNRSYTVIAAVDLTKTKLQLIYQTTLWDVSVSAANNNGRYCYKIEGYFN